jgi:hypothetical protein
VISAGDAVVSPLTIATFSRDRPRIGGFRRSRLRDLGVLAAVLALALAGCTKEAETVPVSCLGEPMGMMIALRQAPGAVTLADGTRLSRCVSSARTDGDLQSLGISLGRTADLLRARAAADPAAALQLGYLAGAVRAGASRATSGIAEQLARRMGQLATLGPGASAAATGALARGARAGERSG